MIDVLHPTNASIEHANEHGNEQQPEDDGDDSGSEPDAEEQAWLESIQSASVTTVQLPQQGTFVMNVGQLREGA
jgi:hypothetical protein